MSCRRLPEPPGLLADRYHIGQELGERAGLPEAERERVACGNIRHLKGAIQRRHRLWRVRQPKQGGGHLVYPFIRALGAEQNSDQQGEGIPMLQRHRGLRVQLL